MSDAITPRAFLEAEGLADWRILGDGATAFFPTARLVKAVELVGAIAAIPGIDDHPPAIDVRSDGVTVRLVTWREDHGGITLGDVALAQQITAAAARLGLRPDPSAVQSLLVIPGAPDIGRVTPFWRAVLGYVPRPDSPREDFVDPHDRSVPLWFETMDEPRPGGLGAIHLAVWVPPEQAPARIEAGLAAGGRIVRDNRAPAWVTLADAYGNEVDVATIAGR